MDDHFTEDAYIKHSHGIVTIGHGSTVISLITPDIYRVTWLYVKGYSRLITLSFAATLLLCYCMYFYTDQSIFGTLGFAGAASDPQPMNGGSADAIAILLTFAALWFTYIIIVINKPKIAGIAIALKSGGRKDMLVDTFGMAFITEAYLVLAYTAHVNASNDPHRPELPNQP